MVAESLSYLDEAWDGRLRASADPTAGAMVMSPAWRDMIGRELPIEVREWRQLEGALWFKISLLWPEPCSGDESMPFATGWVPGYAHDGTPNLWFHSRGC